MTRALLIALALAGCAAPPCRDGAPMTVIELYFGRGGVSDAQWSAFLTEVVTPEFPDGLTSTDAVGQWRDPRSGRIGREPSSVLTIAVPSYDAAKIARIGEAYKRRFDQQSVGKLLSERCGSFD